MFPSCLSIEIHIIPKRFILLYWRFFLIFLLSILYLKSEADNLG